MKYLLSVVVIIFVAISSFILGNKWEEIRPTIPVPTASPTPVPTPFSKYSVPGLSKANIQPGEIEIIETISEEEKYTSYKFRLTFDPEISGSNTKSTTGQLNIPNEGGPFPLVVMFRGYVDPTIYETGIGTRSGAAYFAENGFMTIAPDFLGYADSDSEAGNIFETRFQTYVTAISLINSLDQIDQFDKRNIFIWAHSNGGQIAITTLEATGLPYPTTLWAPVTKPFPYSILYYTDESVDRGRFIRRELALFEEIYNADEYAITDYLDLIQAPIQLHQGTNDNAIPVEWSNTFAAQLEANDVVVEYFVYPGADHNLRPSWDTVVERDLAFFQKYL